MLQSCGLMAHTVTTSLSSKSNLQADDDVGSSETMAPLSLGRPGIIPTLPSPFAAAADPAGALGISPSSSMSSKESSMKAFMPQQPHVSQPPAGARGLIPPPALPQQQLPDELPSAGEPQRHMWRWVPTHVL